MQPEFKQIPINQIHTANNYRKTFHEKSLKELAQSIKENGVLEPIIVRPNASGFEIIAGERRFRASGLAGLVTIPAIVRDVADQDVLRLQIIENVQREGVPFMEEAYGIQRLRHEATLDVAEIASIVGKSDSYVYMMLKLTQMSDEARTIAEKGWISKAVAWHIAKLPNTDFQTKAACDLARTKRSKLVTESTAKSYINDNFVGDTYKALRKQRVKSFGNNDYAANWKYHLVRLDAAQFEEFKKIVRGRTEIAVISEAVDIVMRGGE